MADARGGGSDDDDVTPETDIAGADWLLEQLSGNTPASDATSGSDAESKVDAVERDADTPAAESGRAVPKARWSWQTGTIEPLPGAEQAGSSESKEAASADRAEPADRVEPADRAEPAERAELPTASDGRPSAIEDADGQRFLWGLTPTDEPDPLLHGEPAAHRESASQAEPPETGTQPLTRREAREAAARQAVEPVATTQLPTATEPFAVATTPIAPASPVEAAVAVGAQSRSGADAPVSDPASPAHGRKRPMERSTRILLIAAGGLLLVLVLILLFVLGSRLVRSAQPVSTPTATATHTPTATPTPTPTVPPTPKTTASIGSHPWDALGGGECLQPYTSPWAQNFTVVACTSPHAAQLVLRGSFSTDPAAAYPGADALASQINTLCMKPGVINLSAAGSLNDVQVQGAYPASAEQWQSGQRSYFCFVSRSSGKAITGSLAG